MRLTVLFLFVFLAALALYASPSDEDMFTQISAVDQYGYTAPNIYAEFFDGSGKSIVKLQGGDAGYSQKVTWRNGFMWTTPEALKHTAAIEVTARDCQPVHIPATFDKKADFHRFPYQKPMMKYTLLKEVKLDCKVGDAERLDQSHVERLMMIFDVASQSIVAPGAEAKDLESVRLTWRGWHEAAHLTVAGRKAPMMTPLSPPLVKESSELPPQFYLSMYRATQVNGPLMTDRLYAVVPGVLDRTCSKAERDIYLLRTPQDLKNGISATQDGDLLEMELLNNGFFCAHVKDEKRNFLLRYLTARQKNGDGPWRWYAVNPEPPKVPD